MVNFYLNRIYSGVMTLEEVPDLWKIQVKIKLEELNYISDKEEQ